MRKFRGWLLRCAGLFNRQRKDRDLAEELESHLHMHIEDNLRLGMAPEEARRQALIKLGGIESTKEAYRHQRGLPVIETFWRDIRYGARQLRKNPGFTAVAVLTLALGIGANTAIFSVVDAVVFRALPFHEPDRLVRLWERNSPRGWEYFSVSVPNFEDWREKSKSFERLGAWQWTGFNLTSGGDPEKISAGSITADYLPLLGVSPVLGRCFRPEEDRPGGNNRVVLLGHGLWQRRFGGNTSIVGQGLTLNDTSYTVVGVLPETFRWTLGAELFVPMAANLAVESRENRYLLVIGRLKRGAAIEQARTEMDTLAKGLEAQHPDSNKDWGVRIAPLCDDIVPEQTRRSLLVFLGAVGLVLLIACANVASLMLARASSKRKEMAIRLALGSGRGRLVVQCLSEALLLAAVSGALGLLLAGWGVNLLQSVNPGDVPRLAEAAINGRVFAFTLFATLLTTLLSGLMPSLQAARTSLSEAFKEGARAATGGVNRVRVRSALVVIEIALSLTLLIGAGLLMRSFWALQRVNPGFSPPNLLTMQINLPDTRYSATNGMAFFNEFLGQIRALPGVQGAALTSIAPLGHGNTAIGVVIEGRPAEANGYRPSAAWRMVAPDYFRTMGIPVLRGRDIAQSDLTGTLRAEFPRVAVISDAMARRFWPGEDPVGKAFFWNNNSGPKLTIIGVVGDIRSIGLDKAPSPAIYLPALGDSMTLVMRTSGNSLAHVPAIRSILQRLDGALPVANVRTMEQALANSISSRRFTTSLLGFFAATALLLAAIGLYGVLAYSVAQRTREIGIRMALGARQQNVLSLIVGQGMKLALLGAGIGALAALALTRALRTLLYEIKPADPFTFVGVAALFCCVALFACWLPARRASKVDPIVALRCE